MITDCLANAGLYRHLHPRIAAALDWLAATDLAAVPLGRMPIEDDEIFALVQDYTPKDAALVKLEARRRPGW